ncbi:MAG TPA: hypothetical protein VGC35_06460 [Allosphingosinicella sp.]|jgi:hypothetical protein
MIAALLTAFFMQAAVAPEAPAAVASKVGKSFLNCAARTPAGDLLLLGADAMQQGDKPPLLVLSALPGSPWPQETGAMLAIPTRRVGGEMEWALGPHFVRMGTNAGARNLTIFSSRKGKPAQAVAFGFCDSPQIDASAGAAPAADALSDVFKESRWHDGCFFVAPGPTLRTGRFRMDQSKADGRLRVAFTPVEGDLWPGPVSSTREVLSPAPRSDAPGISLGVGRFEPRDGDNGPRGMDLAFIDERARRLSAVVRFEKFGETGRPGFAICGMKAFKEQTQ